MNERMRLMMELAEVCELMEFAEEGDGQMEELNAQYTDLHLALERLEE